MRISTVEGKKLREILAQAVRHQSTNIDSSAMIRAMKVTLFSSDLLPDMAANQVLRGFMTRVRSPRVRRVLRIVGLALLIGGAIWSVAALDLELAQIAPEFVLINLVLAVLNLLVAGVTLRITARGLKREIPFGEAVQTAAAANLAELLPLPGGAIVRGAALMRSGASLGESGRIVTLTALLTLSMTVLLAGIALLFMGNGAWIFLVVVGLFGLCATSVWLGKRAGMRLLGAMVLVRLISLGIVVPRLAASFAMLAVPVSLVEAALYSLATSLGSTVAIVPAGFGVNEAIAAGLAAMVAGSPAAAFLAVAVNRAFALCIGAIATLAFALKGKNMK